MGGPVLPFTSPLEVLLFTLFVDFAADWHQSQFLDTILWIDFKFTFLSLQ